MLSGFAQFFFIKRSRLLHFKLADGARLGGEVNADAEELATIGSVGTGISLLFDLPQGLPGGTI